MALSRIESWIKCAAPTVRWGFLRVAVGSWVLAAGLFAAEPLHVPVWPGAAAPDGDGGETPATTNLTVYQPDQPNGAAIIICPGGGYSGQTMDQEGHNIARWLGSHGITGLVLQYRLPHGKKLLPLLDAQRAIRLARANAGAWKIDPQRLGIMGFSAGGHLAGTATTRFDAGSPVEGDPVAGYSSRPDFAVLVYPVISMGPLGHAGSRNSLLGDNASPQEIEAFSLEKQVKDQTPPVFLTHAKDDTAVPPENSRMFAEALKRHRVPVEYLELPSGGHGLNGYKGPSWDAWQEASVKWLDARGLLKAKTAPAVGGRMIPANDPQVGRGFSPLNWIHTKDAIHSPVCGASFLLKFAGTKRVVLNVDSARLHYSAPARYPIIAWSVNNGPVQSHQLAAGETAITLAEGVSDPAIDFYIKAISPHEDRFHGDVPANAVSITGFTVDPGCRITPPAEKPLWLNIGDSILSGDGAAFAAKQGRPADDLWPSSDDARSSYGWLLANHYGFRESRLAFGGYAWTGGGGGNPAVAELVDRSTSTTSRLPAGKDKFVPVPRVVLINLGENSAPPANAVTDALTKLRARCATETKILVMIPVSGRARGEVTAAVDSYLRSSKDANTRLIDLGAVQFDTCDGQHPTAAGHQAIYKAALPFFDKALK